MFSLSRTPKAIRAASESNPQLKIFATEDGDIPELMVMDNIGKDFFGEGIAASEVAAFTARHKEAPIKARFNSFGGDAYEGLVMHNAFASHGNVTAVIEGIAFSAASIAAAGAKEIHMQAESDFGIHRSWTIAAGNVNGLKASIEWLEAVDEHQISIFSAKTGESREQVIEWLEGTDDGTIFSASTALEHGFADKVIGNEEKVKDPSAMKRVAAAIKHHRAMAKFVNNC